MKLDGEGKVGSLAWFGLQPSSMDVMEHVGQGHGVHLVGTLVLHVLDQC